MFTKNEKYYYDNQSIKEGGRNKRTVWNINTTPFAEAHFATFPPDLILPCIIASSRPNDFVLDPFLGSGTVGKVATETDRRFVGIELNPEYINIARDRLQLDDMQLLKVVGA